MGRWVYKTSVHFNSSGSAVKFSMSSLALALALRTALYLVTANKGKASCSKQLYTVCYLHIHCMATLDVKRGGCQRAVYKWLYKC